MIIDAPVHVYDDNNKISFTWLHDKNLRSRDFNCVKSLINRF